MTEPTALSVMHNRVPVADELRRLLPKMEGWRAAKSFSFGLTAIDRCLPQGGLACGALHEFVPEQGAMPSAFGFVAALLARFFSERQKQKLFFILPTYRLRDYGRPHSHGVRALGLDPTRLVLVETAHWNDTLWAIEEALHSGAPAAVVGFIDKLDLRSSQRLQLAALDAGLPLFLLRPAQLLEGSAAATRWRVGPASATRDRFGLLARSGWRLMLERCRNGRAGEWIVEYDHVAHHFSLAAALADQAFLRSTGEKSFQQAS